MNIRNPLYMNIQKVIKLLGNKMEIYVNLCQL